jgi:fatty-acyl-CoA synthase
MRGAPALRPKYSTLIEMLAHAARSDVSLFFVDRKEQDLEVPMARVRQRAMSIAADLMARGVQKGDRVAADRPRVRGVPIRRDVCRSHSGAAVSARSARQTR